MSICITVAGGQAYVNGDTLEACQYYILQSAAEVRAATPIYTVDDVVSMSYLVVTCWAVAYGIKLLRRVL
jgi:hypothetical protein